MADATEDTPPLYCEQCGERVWPSDSMIALPEVDAETGEPRAIPGHVVHTKCKAAWDRSQPESP
jgi:hypothetical protein